eukprot:gnl/MRDRNA2_/MRDRNA2_61965_c0_seq1.p1 gnl/MRDRNA2_/MRDRNA2_61965_c0~~gnl/MRDRNA2_/MRDRNA2_61965_c0_seq1.p1  ORF type:complete len:182 (+),score=28.47 gnl/MRDRNA2_/MRDRNA2_61965_c0_seq1:100-645(+)
MSDAASRRSLKSSKTVGTLQQGSEADPAFDDEAEPDTLIRSKTEPLNPQYRRDRQAMDRLLEAQAERLPGIIRELERGHKKGHWIWYVFPTSMPGNCDPRATYVTPLTVGNLFEDPATEQQWQRALELICEQVQNDHMKALPRIDHGRIHHFIKEWKKLNHGSSWMSEVVSRLDKEKWPPR